MNFNAGREPLGAARTGLDYALPSLHSKPDLSGGAQLTAGRNRALRWFAAVISIGLFAGFVTVPISFLTGALRGPNEQVTSAVERDR